MKPITQQGEALKESLKKRWSTAEDHEKNALIVLGVISIGIFTFALGISLGRVIAATL
ncbi:MULTISPECIES: hypothetical protein [Microbulbifer]|uniref:hypothetical protein n=1 Tax=Microbulbifer TaxID=48073 RepID=UPI0012E38E98|nr:MULTISPECIES: hypothetical protein [Microbulbifer]